MKVAAIWRYPVKSMAGERVSRIDVTESGLAGDRIVQVYDRAGRIATARTHPRLLQLRATLGPDGEPLVDGLRWNSSEAKKRVEAAVGPGASLEWFEGPERFDVSPLLVGTDGAGRRLVATSGAFDRICSLATLTASPSDSGQERRCVCPKLKSGSPTSACAAS